MDYQRALVAACSGKAVLFTGAGFSQGAISLDDEPVPIGSQLARTLCSEAGTPTSDDLKQATSRYLRVKTADDLMERLRTIFTVKSVSETHKGIALIPWKSVYTTNYDNVLEVSAAIGGKKFQPLTLGQNPREYRNSANTVLHINGYIETLDSDSLSSSFKLTNTSYLTQQFRESIWSESFIRDTLSAQAIFFVGYSLYDLDIQEILYANETLKEKVFFIQRPGMPDDELKFSELNDFGTILPIGMDKFLEDLRKVDPLAISTENSLVLTGFEEISLSTLNDQKLKDEDVFSLLLKGEVNTNLALNQATSSEAGEYLFKREVQIDFANLLEKNENFLFYGDLGNGKTTLLYLLASHLLVKGYRVFWLKDDAYENFDEVEKIIAEDEPVALIFDNYARKIDLISHANLKRKSNTLFLLSARTSIHEIHEEALYFSKARLDLKKTAELDINKLHELDVERVSAYFEKYGLWGDKAHMHIDAKIRYLKQKCNSEIHGVLLGLLYSPHIRSKFSDLFEEIRNSKKYSRTIIAAFVLNMLNFSRPTVHMIAAMTDDSSIFNPLFKSNSATRQLFNNSHGVITPKSSVLAQYALNNFPDTTVLVEGLVEICRACRKKADANRLYWDIYCDLASFRHIQRILPENGKRESLIAFYEGLRSIEVERKNPHFWLQYAMARLTYPDAKNLEQVKKYLDTAMSLARNKQHYTTMDIETQYARYYLEHAINVATTCGDAYNDFALGHALLSKITRIEAHKREPFRPTRLYEPFFKKYEFSFSTEQKDGILKACESIISNIKRLPPRTAEEKTVLASRDSLTNVQRAIEKTPLGI